MKTNPSDEEHKPIDGEKEQLLATLIQPNPAVLLLRLYFHRTVIDLALLTVGIIYLTKAQKSGAIPLYLTVRGALGLLNILSVIYELHQEPKLTVKVIALKITEAILSLARFSWLIYGTILVSLKSPDERGCNTTCFWTAFGSVVVDWTWMVVVTCMMVFPFCWALTDQFTTLGFFILVAIRKKRQEKKSRNESPG